jgi:hypothetical protein
MGAYVARRLRFQNGERMSALMRRDTGVPVHEAVLFLSVGANNTRPPSDSTRHRHQSGHCLANHADDSPGQRMLPAQVLFSDPEIEVLQAYAKKNESTNPLDSVTPCAL